MPASPAWLAAAEAMLNRQLDESMQARAIARQLEGRSLQVEVTSLTCIRVGVRAGHLVLDSGHGEGSAAAADATITGSAPALIALLRADKAHPVRAGDTSSTVQVRGDAEVANRFRDLLTLSRPDLETEAARLIGDVPARGLAAFARSAWDWGRRASGSARANIAEYLTEESRDLVNKTELSEFLRGVDRAREAADRAEARIAQLERRGRASP